MRSEGAPDAGDAGGTLGQNGARSDSTTVADLTDCAVEIIDPPPESPSMTWITVEGDVDIQVPINRTRGPKVEPHDPEIFDAEIIDDAPGVANSDDTGAGAPDLARLYLDVLGHHPDSLVSLGVQRVGSEFRGSQITVSDLTGETVAGLLGEPANMWAGYNVMKRTEQVRGTNDDVIAVHALAADLDVAPGKFRDYTHIAEAVTVIEDMLGARASALVYSGHGVYPVWPIEPDEVAEPVLPLALKGFQVLVKAVAAAAGASADTVHDLARVWRLPGSTNWKDPDAPVGCTIGFRDDGAPVSVRQILDALDGYAPGWRDVAARSADHVEPVTEDQWATAAHTCAYMRTTVDRWATDTPTSRHGWLVSQAVRLACAARLGCITEVDRKEAAERLATRFLHLLTTGQKRAAGRYEVASAVAWGVECASMKSDEGCRAELGDHGHSVGEDDEFADMHGPRPAKAQGGQEANLPAVPSTWARVDLDDVLDGTYTPPAPDMLPRSDGACLLYRGFTHSIYAESESGKSLLVQWEAARLVESGEDVLYIDFESDKGSVVDRLLQLGASPEAIRAHFDYRRPEDPLTSDADLAQWAALLANTYALAVVDGVTEAMDILAPKDGGDLNERIASFMRRYPRRLADETGAAVVTIDHVPKPQAGQGANRHAIGGQHKLAGLSGAGYTVKVIDQPRPEAVGRLELLVTKDRAGGVRRLAGPPGKSGERLQLAGTVVVDSTVPGMIRVVIEPPGQATRKATDFRPTRLMERVSTWLATHPGWHSRTEIQTAVSGKDTAVRAAVDVLVTEGYVSHREELAGTQTRHYYRKAKGYTELFDEGSE